MMRRSAVLPPIPAIAGLELRPLDLARDLDALAELLSEAGRWT